MKAPPFRKREVDSFRRNGDGGFEGPSHYLKTEIIIKNLGPKIKHRTTIKQIPAFAGMTLKDTYS